VSFLTTGRVPDLTSDDFRRSMEIAIAIKRDGPTRYPLPAPVSRGLVIEAADRCPTPSPFNGANCRRRRCPHCGVPWVRSWQAVSRVNLEHSGHAVVLITITAPGKDLLPWGCGKDHEHSGDRGCKVKDDYADLWCAAAPKQLAMMRDAARQAVKRAGLPVDKLWLERVWEPQKRGVAHVHVVAGADTPLELAAAERFHAELVRLAPDYQFGDRLHITKPMVGEEAARYLAGYLLGRSRKKGTIRDNLGDPRMPKSLIYVSRSLTKITGVTMRRMRVVRWYFAALSGKLAVYPRLYGEELLAVARAAMLVERNDLPPPLLEARHLSALRLMRRIMAGHELVAVA
jgi:hypothetical protein